MATSRNRSKVSEFYLACRNGDVKFVEHYLKNLSDPKCQPNHFEPSVKSTPLHAASYFGHKEIVQLLLGHECDRSQLNGYGLTAFEEAANDEIRELFKRPPDKDGLQRFADENVHDCFDFVKQPKQNSSEATTPVATSLSETKRTSTVQRFKIGSEKQRQIGYASAATAMCQSKLGRSIVDFFTRGSLMSLRSIANGLQEIIDKELTANNDPQSQKANDLLGKFLRDSDDGCIEHLIRLYTLETKFYRALKHNPMALALPLYRALQTLKDRCFQGQCYRGAKMDDDDIAHYEWALHNPGSLLQTRHFTSTSVKRSVAEQFLTGANKKEDHGRRSSVLFIFNFPEKCDQAINLDRISDQQPSLSEFEDEAEVLILPWTLFRVDSVEKESSSPSSYTIYLTSIILPHKNIWSSLAWVLRHPKGSVDYYYEYFPEKLPENVVEQLSKNYAISDKNILKKEV